MPWGDMESRMDSWLYEEGEGEHQRVLPTQTDYYPPSLYMRNHITLIIGSHYYAFRHHIDHWKSLLCIQASFM